MGVSLIRTLSPLAEVAHTYFPKHTAVLRKLLGRAGGQCCAVVIVCSPPRVVGFAPPRFCVPSSLPPPPPFFSFSRKP